MPDVRSLHSRTAALKRHRPADDPAVADAERELKAAVARQYVEELLQTAPPLSDEVRADLASILRPATRGGAA